MRTEVIQRSLDISILAPQENLINSTTPTSFTLCFWEEISSEDRNVVITLLTNAHRRISRRIRLSQERELKSLIANCNQILTREAVLCAEYPEFRRHGAYLKDIFLEAIIFQANENAEFGTSRSVDEIAQVFREVIGLRGVKPIR